jgi:DNA (cytosine-5)-methyltransferase 1
MGGVDIETKPVVFGAQNSANQGLSASTDVSPTLDTSKTPGVAFQQNTRDEVRYINGDGKIVGALAANSGAKQTNYLQQNMKVRRLTPIECERLQGFPDNYTRIPYRNKEASDCPDGPRYKAMGNSMAVPVMRWIGERINLINNLNVPDTREAT